jgi:hypothetical protein
LTIIRPENENDAFLSIMVSKTSGESCMAQQLILPMIPIGATEINDHVSAWRGEDRWTYFLGTHPIYSHHANDYRMFRLITSMLIDSGACRQIEIIRTFGVSKSNIDRSLRMLRTGGPESFFKPTHKGRRGGGKVLNRETLENAQRLLIPLRFQDGTNSRPVGQLPGC